VPFLNVFGEDVGCIERSEVVWRSGVRRLEENVDERQ